MGHARTSSHEKHHKKSEEIKESVWLKESSKIDIAPPWTFLADLDLRNASSMRRVATYFHYRIVEKRHRQDPLMPELEGKESRELNRMEDEWAGNELLMDMLLWFSTFREAKDKQMLYRAKELGRLVNNYVRKPKQYPKEHAQERINWDNKVKRYGGTGKPVVTETLGNDKEAEEAIAMRRTRQIANTTPATTPSETEATQRSTRDFESLPIEERTNQAPIFETGTEDIEEGAKDSDVEMRERSEEEQAVGYRHDGAGWSLWSTNIASKPILDSETATERKRKIEELGSQGSESPSSAISTPPFKRGRQPLRESTDASNRLKSTASLEDGNNSDDDSEMLSSAPSTPPFVRGRGSRRESTAMSSRPKSNTPVEDQINNDDHSNGSYYSSDDVRPHVSNRENEEGKSLISKIYY
jgi:hypothetical protein